MCVPWALGPWWKVPVQRLWSLKEFTASPKFSSAITHQLETEAATKQNRWLLTLWSWSRANCFEAGQEQTGALLTEQSASREARVATLTRRAPTEECCAPRPPFVSAQKPKVGNGNRRWNNISTWFVLVKLFIAKEKCLLKKLWCAALQRRSVARPELLSQVLKMVASTCKCSIVLVYIY